MATEVSVVHTMDDLMKAFAIRSAVFIKEQECPYEEEFDGNDFSATHILVSVDGEPAGSMRIRYFGTFAKPERAAVLPRYRGKGIAVQMVDYAAWLCMKKGYRTLYGHAQLRLVGFWEARGWVTVPAPRFWFSGYEYQMICRHLPPLDDALGMDEEPMVLLRPEGQWDKPGVLEDVR